MFNDFLVMCIYKNYVFIIDTSNRRIQVFTFIFGHKIIGEYDITDIYNC
jgi:hypothetical protein